jgi:two-component system, sensor histidine kinase PdtaS
MIRKLFYWTKSTYFYVITISILFGCLFWIIDGLIEFLYFRDNLHFLIVEGPQTYFESILLKVSPHGIFVRVSFLIASIFGGLLVSLFILKRKKAERDLRVSEEKFRTIFNTIIDVYYRSDINGNIQMVSPSGTKVLGYENISEILGKNIAKELYYNPKGREEFQRCLEKDGKVLNFQSTLKRKDGTLIVVETNSHYIYDKMGKPIAVEGIFRDITKRTLAEKELKKAYDNLEVKVEERTKELSYSYKLLEKEVDERKQAQKRLLSSISDKEVLLREVHHRVKNNFEIVSSLMDIGSMQTKNQETQKVLQDARNRIHSMALIHNQLYQNDHFDQIKMEKHAKQLVDHLSYIYSGIGKIIVPVIEPSDVYLSVNQAIPCALVLNELIANAYKHAFRAKDNGTVWISVKYSADNKVLIKVKDDGDGIPEGIDPNNANSLGFTIVRQLIVGQLKGDIRIKNENGTDICVEFKTAHEER